MRAPPRPTGVRLMVRSEWLSLTGVGALMAVAALFVFWWAGGGDHAGHADPAALARARALCFTLLSISPMFHALNCRSETRSIFDLGMFTNRAVWGAFGVGVVLQALALYVPFLNPVFKTEPLGLDDVIAVLLLSMVMLAGGEVLKIFLRRRAPTSSA